MFDDEKLAREFKVRLVDAWAIDQLIQERMEAARRPPDPPKEWTIADDDPGLPVMLAELEKDPENWEFLKKELPYLYEMLQEIVRKNDPRNL